MSGLLRALFGRKKEVAKISETKDSESFRQDFLDYLGAAAVAKSAAKLAIKEGRYDDAWKSLHEQQDNYLKHARRAGFSVIQSLSLSSQVNEDMANILRLEGKHDDALAHVMYRSAVNVLAGGSMQKNIGAYLRRCKFDSVSEAQLEDAVVVISKNPDFRSAKLAVSEWRLKQ